MKTRIYCICLGVVHASKMYCQENEVSISSGISQKPADDIHFRIDFV